MSATTRILVLLGALLVALLLALRMGAVSLPVVEIVQALQGRGEAASVAIVRELRLPRSVLAALVGVALATSGATFQALLRNPLAEPYILGVSGGAALGAVAAIVLGAAANAWSLPAAAFAGAVVAIALVLRIAVSVGRALDTRILLLAGVVAAAFFNAWILLALTFADTESFRSAIFWMMGSFSGASWRGTAILGLYLIPGLALLLALARPLDLLSIGEDTAAHLGVRVEVVKYVAYGVASMLAAASVAASGVIGFVGLIVPHFVRLLWGSGHRFLLTASALLGASFLVLTDALARTVAAPVELPVGVLTAFVGVPFFVWVLKRSDSRPAAAGAGARGRWSGRGVEVAPRTPPAAGVEGASSGAGRPARSRPGDSIASASAATAAPPPCQAAGLSYRYPDAAAPAVAGVNLTLGPGSITAVLGPNGSGKSTLLRLLVGTLPPDEGSVRILGRPLADWPRRDLARRVAVVRQSEEIAFPVTVRELVALGRYPYLGNWRRESAGDAAAIDAALRLCDVSDLSARAVQTLSGGERQRVRLARALAQEPEILFLDEPTVALDIQHEMAIFALLRTLAARGVAILVITHNLNLAARYAEQLVVLERGRVARSGTPSSVLQRELVERVYGWPVSITPHPGPGPDTGAPQVTPLTNS